MSSGGGPARQAWLAQRCEPSLLGHLTRVATLARELARHAGLSPGQQHDAEQAGLLHDLGKLQLPQAILAKNTRLDAVEERIVHRHPELGAVWVGRQCGPAVAEAVRHHHERIDGQGYPDGLCAGLLPVVSRLIPVVDAYDVMTWGRPYQAPVPRERAYEELRAVAGRQLDAALVEALIDLETTRPAVRAA